VRGRLTHTHTHRKSSFWNVSLVLSVGWGLLRERWRKTSLTYDAGNSNLLQVITVRCRLYRYENCNHGSWQFEGRQARESVIHYYSLSSCKIDNGRNSPAVHYFTLLRYCWGERNHTNIMKLVRAAKRLNQRGWPLRFELKVSKPDDRSSSQMANGLNVHRFSYRACNHSCRTCNHDYRPCNYAYRLCDDETTISFAL